MHRLLCCLLLAVMAGAGQTTPAAKPVATPTKKNAATPKGPGHSAGSDVEIEKKINARFAASKISVNHFQAHVQGGVATLTGRTDVIQHKGTATRLAKSSGATQVVNQIVVSDAAKEKASKNLASGGRRAQVKRSDVPGRK